MTNYSKGKIKMYYDILTKWNYNRNFIQKKMKEYLTKDEYKYFLKRIFYSKKYIIITEKSID